jgi:Protein of unknown function (DUF3108)
MFLNQLKFLPNASAGRPVSAVISALFLFVLAATAFPQSGPGPSSTIFRVGEKLSYAVSFENVKDAAYFETAVVSHGKLASNDVVEIRGRLKTFDIVSAALSMIDERRTVFADPVSGRPILIKRTFMDQVLPRETVTNYLAATGSNFDLLTLLYMLRSSGGNGSFSIVEGNDTSILIAEAKKAERVSTDLGEYDTVISTITGTYLDTRGIKKLRVNLTNNEARLPVMIQFSTSKGSYRAVLTSVADITPESVSVPDLLSVPAPTPFPTPAPKAVAVPTPYVENRPLLPELSFDLGERLEYRITQAGRATGTLILSAPERKQVGGRDSLRLMATMTGVEQSNGVFAPGDMISALVNPDTLAPFQGDMKFSRALRNLSQTLVFDSRSGAVVTGAAISIEAPVGTHTLLSLLYAMRSFNLKPSKESANPVNDTRVAVFWNDRPYVFTLRPGNAETIPFEGNTLPAQPITINTGNTELDRLTIKVWLGTDDRRLPLRFSGGGYQADLVAVSNTLIKK